MVRVWWAPAQVGPLFMSSALMRQEFGRRAAHRFSVALPVVIELAGEKSSARLINLGRPGALIEAQRPLTMGTTLVLHCGTVVVAAYVVWTEGSRIGLGFARSLTDQQVQEQVSRGRALLARRQGRDHGRSLHFPSASEGPRPNLN